MLPRGSCVNPCSTRGGLGRVSVGSYAFALTTAGLLHPSLLCSHGPGWIALPERLGPEGGLLVRGHCLKLAGGYLG